MCDVFGCEGFHGGFSVSKEILSGFAVFSRLQRPSMRNDKQVIKHGNLSLSTEGSLRLRKDKTSFSGRQHVSARATAG